MLHLLATSAEAKITDATKRLLMRSRLIRVSADPVESNALQLVSSEFSPERDFMGPSRLMMALSNTQFVPTDSVTALVQFGVMLLAA